MRVIIFPELVPRSAPQHHAVQRIQTVVAMIPASASHRPKLAVMVWLATSFPVSAGISIPPHSVNARLMNAIETTG